MAGVHLSDLILIFSSCLLASCAGESPGPGGYVDGQRKAGAHGAFSITLFHEDGAPQQGANDFLVRFAMVDPARPDDEGRGVPGLELAVEAWMPGAAHRSPPPARISYEGDGHYRVQELELNEDGWWRLDFVARRASIREEVRFEFRLEDQ